MSDVTNTISIPSGVTVKLDGLHLTAKGKAGAIDRTYKMHGVSAKMSGSNIEVVGPLREANTLSAHIRNALNGAEKGYTQKLKIVYAHFPIALEIKGKQVVIKNFLGEKQPRHADIVGATKVESKGAEVNVSGPDRDDVGQTIANLRTATKIRNRDSRVFQDGIYPVEG
ncbi:50S ribosomal protein L6 [uncultured archaeon]|nr:50S ribosomal protein L6 [uncultured archaeon]